jgi:hypothetical protein
MHEVYVRHAFIAHFERGTGDECATPVIAYHHAERLEVPEGLLNGAEAGGKRACESPFGRIR